MINLIMKESSGPDISSYVWNAKWDLMGATGKRNEIFYECCEEPYLDITYTIKLKDREYYAYSCGNNVIPLNVLIFPILLELFRKWIQV